MSSETYTDNHSTLRCDRNRHGGRAVCYIRNDFSYDVKSIFQPEIEKLLLKTLLPNAKPIVFEIIYLPPMHLDFSEIRSTRSSRLNTNNNEIYILSDSNVKTSILITHTFFKKIICFRANQFLVTVKNTINSAEFFILNN